MGQLPLARADAWPGSAPKRRSRLPRATGPAHRECWERAGGELARPPAPAALREWEPAATHARPHQTLHGQNPVEVLDRFGAPPGADLPNEASLLTKLRLTRYTPRVPPGGLEPPPFRNAFLCIGVVCP